jgi:hypothetical protein
VTRKSSNFLEKMTKTDKNPNKHQKSSFLRLESNQTQFKRHILITADKPWYCPVIGPALVCTAFLSKCSPVQARQFGSVPVSR